MSRSLKVSALLIFVLAVVFYLFFQVSKHNPALLAVNAFGDDPYDAVGSLGVQLTMFTALLSLVRALRPYSSTEVLDRQKLLFVRGAYLSCLSVLVTLVADIVALVRHPSIWLGLPAGSLLAGMVGAMVVLTALVIKSIRHGTQIRQTPAPRSVWIRAIGITCLCILCLGFYPEGLRQSLLGELFTACFGIVFLFVIVRAISDALFPSPETFLEDLLDDLNAIYLWLKTHVGPFRVCFTVLEQMLALPLVHSVLCWLNPRKYTWNFAIVLGVIIGAGLAFLEGLSEGVGSAYMGRFMLIVAIFIGLECLGLLLGYLLFAKSLWLFRSPKKSALQSTL